MVTVAFISVEGTEPRIDDCISPRSKIRLVGRCLYDGDGLLLAELIQDQEGREFWLACCVVNDPNETRNVFQELAFVGIGKLNL